MAFLLRLLARCVPRRRSLWVFSSGQGGFAGNPKYLFLWTQLNRPDISPIWLGKDTASVALIRNSKLPVVQRRSLRGIWLQLRAGIHIYDGTPDALTNAAGAGAVHVNLWHGVGVKNVENSINVGPTAQAYKGRALGPQPRPDLICTSSQAQSIRLANAFQVPRSRCVELGTPRLDIMFDPKLRSHATALENFSSVESIFATHKERYIYMPTFRDTGRDFLHAGFPDLARVNHVLASRDAYLFLKPHRKTRDTKLVIPPACRNIGWWPSDLDVYPMLPRFELLLTDYSSILFDFLAIRAEGAMLYTFDWDEYRCQDRDLAYSIDEWAICERVDNFETLCHALMTGRALKPISVPKLDELRNKFWGGGASLSSPRIVEFLTRTTAFN